MAAPCEEIAKDPHKADIYTSKSNLVAVISNGTAVLGLGNIGALAGKPVMEGKAVLFKKFAGIDSIDIEVDETDVDKFIAVVRPLEPSFGGINLEDIKAPDCFAIEESLRESMNIPVFHDDQHGTAIITAAAVLNGLEIAGKKIDDVKIVTSGAGAAAIACLNLLVSLGAKRENIWIGDRKGIVTEARKDSVDRWRGAYAQKTDLTDLKDAMDGADIFLGLSGPGTLTPDMVKVMARDPLVLALANPVPEIMPELALEVRPDAMVCTGRSDYPNQVNNVLCFPFLFRGALDVGATAINEDMKMAAVRAIAKLAHEPALEASSSGQGNTFGRSYLIPSPFDKRLILRISPAVAKAAMDSGVARRPIDDFEAYHEKLNRFVFRSGLVMEPVIARAGSNPKRIAFADGEDERVLRATQVLLEENLIRPILIGRPAVIEHRIERFGLTLEPGRDFEIINPESDPRYRDYVDLYHSLVGRKGITPDTARNPCAHAHLGDRGPGGQARRCRRHAMRSAGPVHRPCRDAEIGHRAAAGHFRHRRIVDADHAARHSEPCRHLYEHRSDRRRGRQHHSRGARAPAAVPDRDAGSASELLEFRLTRRRHVLQDARSL